MSKTIRRKNAWDKPIALQALNEKRTQTMIPISSRSPSWPVSQSSPFMGRLSERIRSLHDRRDGLFETTQDHEEAFCFSSLSDFGHDIARCEAASRPKRSHNVAEARSITQNHSKQPNKSQKLNALNAHMDNMLGIQKEWGCTKRRHKYQGWREEDVRLRHDRLYHSDNFYDDDREHLWKKGCARELRNHGRQELRKSLLRGEEDALLPTSPKASGWAWDWWYRY